MAVEEKQGNKMFIFRTTPVIRDDVARFAAKRVIEGKTGVFTASTYSSNQVYVEAVCKELGIQYSPQSKAEDPRETVGISINFPVHVHQALMNSAKEQERSMNALLNEIVERYMHQEDSGSSM